MDWLTFISAMVGNLAWPAVAALAVILFRSSIIQRLPYLTKASWGDKSLEFSDRLEEAAEKVIQLAPSDEIKALPAPEDPTIENPEEENFRTALQASPRLAVLQTWLPLEQQLQRIARGKGYSADRTRSATYTIRQLQNDGTISAETASLLKDLMSLRNIAAHGGPEQEISSMDAVEYRSIADFIHSQLSNINP